MSDEPFVLRHSLPPKPNPGWIIKAFDLDKKHGWEIAMTLPEVRECPFDYIYDITYHTRRHNSWTPNAI